MVNSYANDGPDVPMVEIGSTFVRRVNADGSHPNVWPPVFAGGQSVSVSEIGADGAMERCSNEMPIGDENRRPMVIGVVVGVRRGRSVRRSDCDDRGRYCWRRRRRWLVSSLAESEPAAVFGCGVVDRAMLSAPEMVSDCRGVNCAVGSVSHDCGV